MNMSICVLCPYGLDHGLVSKAIEIAAGHPVRILIPESDLVQAIKTGAAFIHTVAKLSIDEKSVALWLKDKIEAWQSKVILAPATVQMRNIMPMLAWYLNAGLTADCTQLSLEDDEFLQTRPAFGNSLMATITTRSKIKMATVCPGTFRANTVTVATPEIIRETSVFPDSPINQSDFQPYENNIPISQSKIIIAGGLGVGSREGFQKLEMLAKKVNGTVAASRSAVDAGFAPYRCQVGMTGVTVSPKLYIAIGISGAVQHLAGMSGSEKIIAINSDPKAAIFDYADYGIVGNWETVIDTLMEELS